MSDVVIRVENLGKRYQLGKSAGGRGYRTFRDVVTDKLSAPFRRFSVSGSQLSTLNSQPASPSSDSFWALKDVSFDVKQGEVVGIIGRNGAGKSTLLKILSRITDPTEGRVSIRGRIASLLEVGTGFHPELTGRENIFLNGAILGMHRHEIKAKFDEIVAFAEVEKFLDTPVKRYSSGMYVRLAFAVAAHLEPEILIVDEVLAVGDAAFQKKCLGQMEHVARAGRTVLFVSHNMGILANMCTSAILLKDGTKAAEGETRNVVGTYIQLGSTNSGSVQWDLDDPSAGDEFVRLLRACILCQGETTHDVLIDEEVTVQFDFEVLQSRLNVASSIHLYDKHGIWVLSSATRAQMVTSGIYRHQYFLPAKFLNDGLYSISLILIIDTTNIQIWIRDAVTFFVHETGYAREEFSGVIGGCIRPFLRTAERRLEPPEDRAPLSKALRE